MRRLRLLISVLLIALLPAPLAAHPDAASTAKAFLAAMTAKDRAAVVALIDKAAVFEYPFERSGRTEQGSWRRFEGRDAVIGGYIDNAFAQIAKIAWTDAQFTQSADAGIVFVEALGDMVLADGTLYKNRYVLRFDVRQGRVRGLREYMNPVTAALAVGAPLGPTR